MGKMKDLAIKEMNKDLKMKRDGYSKTLDNVYNKPPRTVPFLVEKIMEKYPTELYCISEISYLMIVKINKNHYGISWICTEKEFQNRGCMRSLMNQVLNEKKGLFIAKTDDDGFGFYEKFGFSKIELRKGKYLMILCNDESKIDY